MKLSMKLAVSAAAIAILAGCGRDEPEVYTPVMAAPAETPIYAKDGTVVGMRPVVGHSGSDGSTSVMSDDDDDGYED